MNWKKLVGFVLILIVIALVVGSCNSLSKLEKRVDSIDQLITKLEANDTQLADSFNKQAAYVKSVEGQLTTALTDLNNAIATVKSLVQNEATQRSADTATLENNIAVINASLSDLSTRVNALEVAVEDLEAEATEGELTAEITSTDGLEIDEGDSEFSGTIVVKVSNDTNDDLEDIELSLSFEADEDIPDVDTARLTGGSITWTFDGQDDNTLRFSNPNGFDVDEGSYKKMTLTLEVYFEDEVTEDTTFDASVEITDYSS